MEPTTYPLILPSMPKSYPGGKGAEATIRTIINQIPRHKRYYELFLGGGAVMRHKRPAEVNEAWERDELIAEIWMREAPEWCKVHCGDVLPVVHSASWKRSDFLFVDPPYLKGTLSRTMLLKYGHWMSDEQHLELIASLRRTKARVMLCALPNLLYENLLSDWRTLQYRNVGRSGPYWEQLWMNYAEPTDLHDYRFLGKEYREREAIKDRRTTLVNRIRTMPVLERNALLEELKLKQA